ncbi:MAG: hypothetical protein ACHREM_18555, partial [Polyangiales bacterium]
MTDASLTTAATGSAAPTRPGVIPWIAHDKAFVAFQRTQRWTTTVDAHGASLSPSATGTGATWSLGLHLTGIGRGTSITRVNAASAVGRRGRIELARDGVTEWYVRQAGGLEQGFDVAQKPNGSGDVVLEVAVDGLTPTLAKDGKSVVLSDAHGARALTYGRLAVADADGHSVPAWMEVVGATIALYVRDAGARYPLIVDPTLSDGAVCAAVTDCTSGFCEEGVCCDTACAGSCNSCLASRSGGTDGTCAPVSSMSKCASCNVDGDCSYTSPAYCVGKICTGPGAVGAPCVGFESCVSGYCVAGTCTSGALGQPCAAATDCAPAATYPCNTLTSRCDSGPKAGVSCIWDSDCALAASCVEGFCCNSPCSGPGFSCSSCRATQTGGTDGTCASVTSISKCASCTTDTDCDFTAHAYCAGTTCTLAGANGAPCTATDQCAWGSCVSGVCFAVAIGQPCTANTDCVGGICMTGVCCDTVCGDSLCYACTAAMKGSGSDGTCGPIAVGTDPRGAFPLARNLSVAARVFEQGTHAHVPRALRRPSRLRRRLFAAAFGLAR